MVPLANSYYGAGSGQIWVDDIDCAGNETNLGSCAHKPWGVNDCDHTEDASVMCLSMCVLYKNSKITYMNCKKILITLFFNYLNYLYRNALHGFFLYGQCIYLYCKWSVT